MKTELHESMKKDLGISQLSSELFNIGPVLSQAKLIIKNLKQWMKPRKVDNMMVGGPSQSYLHPQPFGTILVISSWNFPIFTALNPFLCALGAGNCVVLKPSELAENSALSLQKLVETYLDNDCYRVIQGKVEVAKKLTSLKFDQIIFTGSSEKGKLVAQAAAKNLVPVLLELGGRCPAIVDYNADLEVAAMRIVQGRFMNCGQVCLSPNHVLVNEQVYERLLSLLIKYTRQFYGEQAEKSEDYGRICQQYQMERLIELSKQGQIVYQGGQIDINNRFFPPTIIDHIATGSPLDTEEVFGPILPIKQFKNIHDLIQEMQSQEKPLAIYYFGDKKHSNAISLIESSCSGALVFNECVLQATNQLLPFGGVGNSGTGVVNGIWGFNQCSHLKPIFIKSTLNIFPFSSRYPPYDESKKRMLNMFMRDPLLTQECLKKVILLIVFIILFMILSGLFWRIY